MNKITGIAVVLTAYAAASAARGYWDGLIEDLQERFPEIPNKDVRKVFRKFMMKSITGALPDLSDYTDEQMDELFKIELLDMYLKELKA